MTGFAWNPGAPFSGDPEAVKAEFDRIERQAGGLTPEAVVTAAKRKSSPLHPLIFDGTTAEEALDKYRLARARSLLVSIVIADDEGNPTPIRSHYRIVTDEGESRYVDVNVVGTRERALERLLRDMRALKRQLSALEVYPAVALALEEVLAA